MLKLKDQVRYIKSVIIKCQYFFYKKIIYKTDEYSRQGIL